MAIIEVAALVGITSSALTLGRAIYDYVQRKRKPIAQQTLPMTRQLSNAGALPLELIGAEMKNSKAISTRTKSSMALPFMGEFSFETNTLTYRAAEAHELMKSQGWLTLEVDPKTTLKQAIQLFGDKLVGFERRGQSATLDVAFLWEIDVSRRSARIFLKKHAEEDTSLDVSVEGHSSRQP